MGLLNIIRLANDYHKLKKFIVDAKVVFVNSEQVVKMQQAINRIDEIVKKITYIVRQAKKVLNTITNAEEE